MDQRQRMDAGLPYKPWLDGLAEARLAAKQTWHTYNQLPPERWEEAMALMRRFLGKTGEDFFIEAPFYCDYGFNIEIGENFFSNYNLTILDGGKVRIGDNVQIAPNVSIYTAGHPLHPQARNTGYEYAFPVTIGNNVWIGGSVTILPGVTIGDNAVIGAGSVVSRDIPPNAVAVGNPCRVVRTITDADRDFFCRGMPFDVDDYLTEENPLDKS